LSENERNRVQAYSKTEQNQIPPSLRLSGINFNILAQD
jgi:hypothetical protein